MTLNDRFTIAISAAALFIASASFYFGEIRKTDNVEAIVLEADPLGGRMLYQVAIVNHGNQSALIKSAKLQLQSPPGELIADDPLKSIKVSPDLPVVVEKDKILVVTFSGDLNLPHLFERGEVGPSSLGVDEFDGQETKEIQIDAVFESMDSSGSVFRAQTGPLKAANTKLKVAASASEGIKRALFKP